MNDKPGGGTDIEWDSHHLREDNLVYHHTGLESGYILEVHHVVFENRLRTPNRDDDSGLKQCHSIHKHRSQTLYAQRTLWPMFPLIFDHDGISTIILLEAVSVPGTNAGFHVGRMCL
uniref:Alpha-carbonic anhydrase domain-containing protein n=1 Tax=Heterorhabditis bacteriophora TaxID=37862 RepID=A0A1I7XQ94_HETBA